MAEYLKQIHILLAVVNETTQQQGRLKVFKTVPKVEAAKALIVEALAVLASDDCKK